LGDKSLQQDHHAHTKRRTQQHQFTAFAIGQTAPQRGDRRRNHEGDTEGEPRPETQGLASGDAKLLKVERQKRDNLADGQASKKTAKPDRDQVYLPGFNNAWHGQIIQREGVLSLTRRFLT